MLIHHTFDACVTNTGSYVCALGPRRPGDFILTPQGFLSICNLGYTDGLPDKALHTTRTHHVLIDVCDALYDLMFASLLIGLTSSSEFAAAPLMADLLSVLGQLPGSTTPQSYDMKPFTSSIDCVPISPLVYELLMRCRQAFRSARSYAPALLTSVGCAMVCSHVP